MDKSLRSSICEHWAEYLIEAWASSCLMIAVGLFVTAFESPKSLAYAGTTSPGLRIVLLATAVGITLTLLIQSPWGKRSGAHMNPAITVAFFRLRKMHRWDALFYILAQTIGGILGISVVACLVGSPFTDPPVRYAVTVPGTAGAIVAFMAEILISFALMSAILVFTASTGLKRFTGIVVGCLVAFLIVIEAPLSGASMNPARSLASAVAGMMWQHLWIYLSGPILGMLMAAEIFNRRRRQNLSGCAKLLHPNNVRCIHCGYCPRNIL